MIRKYNEEETGKMEEYFSSNGIKLIPGEGIGDKEDYARRYKLGEDYGLIFTRVIGGDLKTSTLEGNPEKISELEEKVNN